MPTQYTRIVGSERVLELVDEIPDDLAAEIGRFIYSFSVLEDKLKSLVYALCGVEHKLGRLVIREPRAPELFDLARELFSMHGIELLATPKEIARMRSNIEMANSRRDALAHSVICKDVETEFLHILSTRGQWKPNDGTKSLRTSRVRRAIRPQGTKIDANSVRAAFQVIPPLIRAVDEIGNSLNGRQGTVERKDK